MLSDMEMGGRSYRRCFKIPFQRGKDGRGEGRGHDGRSWVWFPTGSFMCVVFIRLHRCFFLVPVNGRRCECKWLFASMCLRCNPLLTPEDNCNQLHLLENGCIDGESFQRSELEEVITSCNFQWEHFLLWNIKNLPCGWQSSSDVRVFKRMQLRENDGSLRHRSRWRPVHFFWSGNYGLRGRRGR